MRSSGIQVSTTEDGAGWLAFFRDLTARGLSGVKLVTSDARRGLRVAIEADAARGGLATLPHSRRGDLMSVTPWNSWAWVKALLHSIYDQPDLKAVHAQCDRVIDALAGKLPAVAAP